MPGPQTPGGKKGMWIAVIVIALIVVLAVITWLVGRGSGTKGNTNATNAGANFTTNTASNATTNRSTNTNVGVTINANVGTTANTNTAKNVNASTNANVSTSATVSITSTGFSPSTLTVKAGTAVTFKNTDTNTHWPASNPHPIHTDLPGFDALKALKNGETYSFTFTKIGTFGYHDHPNGSPTGTIIVE